MKHVVLVEDDPAIRDSLTLFFSKMNVRLTCFQDGYAILEGDYEHPDMFLLDKQLSGIDGLDLCRHLKKRADLKHIPVVMMSATPRLVALSEAAGADDVIVKPYKLDDLRIILSKFLG